MNRIARIAGAAYGVPSGKLRAAAEQLVQRDVRIELEDRPGEEAVRFLMHRLQSLLVRPLGEAEYRTVGRIEPVRVEMHAMLLLDFDVPHVRAGELLRGHSGRVVQSMY